MNENENKPPKEVKFPITLGGSWPSAATTIGLGVVTGTIPNMKVTISDPVEYELVREEVRRICKKGSDRSLEVRRSVVPPQQALELKQPESIEETVAKVVKAMLSTGGAGPAASSTPKAAEKVAKPNEVWCGDVYHQRSSNCWVEVRKITGDGLCICASIGGKSEIATIQTSSILGSGSYVLVKRGHKPDARVNGGRS